jgi:hypothetical protein
MIPARDCEGHHTPASFLPKGKPKDAAQIGGNIPLAPCARKNPAEDVLPEAAGLGSQTGFGIYRDQVTRFASHAAKDF